MKENLDQSNDDIPVADLAAEATNDGSPALAINENNRTSPRHRKPQRRAEPGESPQETPKSGRKENG